MTKSADLFFVCEKGLQLAISPFPDMLGTSRLKYKLHLKATVHLTTLSLVIYSY